MKSVREIFAENLLELIESKKIDQRDLAVYLGVSDSAISHWIKGNKYPRIDKIQKMADFFNVPKSRLTEVKPENVEEITPIFVKIPILGEIACGDPLIIEEQTAGYMWELKDSLPHGELFALKTKGGTMSAVKDENTITFIKSELELARELVELIESKRHETKSEPTQQLSAADELIKYKGLLDAGVLTQEEFDAKKKQLLGI